jgi:cytochrome c peroxidase
VPSIAQGAANCADSIRICPSAISLAGIAASSRVLLIAAIVFTGHAHAFDLVARQEEGRELFFDQALSSDGHTSCASCHQPDLAFADGLRVARGAGGKTGTRNTPSLLDVAEHGRPFWDGRAEDLIDQVRQPLLNPIEHGLVSQEEVLSRVLARETHRRGLSRAFEIDPSQIAFEHVERAIAAYEATLSSGESPIDRYLRGDSTALSAAEQRGLQIFQGPGRCVECHPLTGSRAVLTDNRYHAVSRAFSQFGDRLAPAVLRASSRETSNIGDLIASDDVIAALGRFNVTKRLEDIASFKTPSLRNVELTAPYMHDGSVADLEDAVRQELYYRSERDGVPLVFTPDEKRDLVSFLRALTSDNLKSASVPSQKSKPPATYMPSRQEKGT